MMLKKLLLQQRLPPQQRNQSQKKRKTKVPLMKLKLSIIKMPQNYIKLLLFIQMLPSQRLKKQLLNQRLKKLLLPNQRLKKLPSLPSQRPLKLLLLSQRLPKLLLLSQRPPKPPLNQRLPNQKLLPSLQFMLELQRLPLQLIKPLSQKRNLLPQLKKMRIKKPQKI